MKGKYLGLCLFVIGATLLTNISDENKEYSSQLKHDCKEKLKFE